jgi:hypothetical protein
VGEFLIGDNAFGTVAKLNLTSQAVRAETLPVLYETLCLDRMDAEEYLKRNKASASLKYTKYVAFKDIWQRATAY